MAFFARRVIHNKLELLRRGVLTSEQADRFVGQLNSASRHVVATEWELVVTAAVAQHANVKYEALVGACHPDLCVNRANRYRGINFIADITAVSDRGVEDQNPIEFARERVVMMAIKRGVDVNAFRWSVGDRFDGRYPDQVLKLLLPSKHDLQSFLETSIRPFLDGIKNDPARAVDISWTSPGIDLKLSYRPDGSFSGTRGVLALVPYSKTRNPLYGALKRKAAALSKSKFRGVRGIIVGDAGSNSLRQSYGGSQSFEAKEIIVEFLQNFESVHFVTTSRYEHQSSYMSERGHFLRNRVHFQSSLSTRLRERYLHF